MVQGPETTQNPPDMGRKSNWQYRLRGNARKDAVSLVDTFKDVGCPEAWTFSIITVRWPQLMLAPWLEPFIALLCEELIVQFGCP